MPLTSIVFALFIASVASAQTPPASTQLMSLQTVTVTEEQFLTGSRDGRPVTIAAELRFPSAGTERVPAMILLHGSGGINAQDVQWAKELNDLGVAALLVDSFTGRGIVSTVGDQTQLSPLVGIIDAYRALELLAGDRAQIAGCHRNRRDDVVLAGSFRTQHLRIELNLRTACNQSGVERQQLFAVQLFVKRMQDARELIDCARADLLGENL